MSNFWGAVHHNHMVSDDLFTHSRYALRRYLMPFQARGEKDHYCAQHQRAAHRQMDAVEHGLLRRSGGGKFLADIGRTDEKCRTDGAGNRVDGGQNCRAVGIEFFRQRVQAETFAKKPFHRQPKPKHRFSSISAPNHS